LIVLYRVFPISIEGINGGDNLTNGIGLFESSQIFIIQIIIKPGFSSVNNHSSTIAGLVHSEIAVKKIQEGWIFVDEPFLLTVYSATLVCGLIFVKMSTIYC